MKYSDFLLDHRLCDVFSPVSAGISAGSNLAANAATNYTNYQIAQETNQAQKDMLSQSQDFSHKEAEIAYQRDLEKMKMEQQYNSPVEQVKRYQEAGINPAVAMSGNMGAASAGNVSASSGSPQAMTPNIPLLHAPQMIAPDISQVGQIYKAIAEGRKTDVETKQLQASFGKILEQFDLTNEKTRIENFLTSTFGPALKDSQVRSNLASATQALAAAFNYREAGKTEESKRALNEALTFMNQATGSLRSNEATLARQNIDAFGQRLEQEIKESNSRIAENYASAALSREQANEIRTLLPTKEQMLKADVTLRQAQTEYTWRQVGESRELQRKLGKECALLSAKIKGQELSNEQLETLSKYYERQIQYETESMYIHKEQQLSDYCNLFKFVGGLLGAPAAAAIKGAIK